MTTAAEAALAAQKAIDDTNKDWDAKEASKMAEIAAEIQRANCQNEPVLKLDQGKVPVWRGVISYFPRALRAVAKVSDFGAKKYSWGGWAKTKTPDRMERYADAFMRHQLAIAERGFDAVDPETGLLELAHVAWNALGLLELVQRDKEEKLDDEVRTTTFGPDRSWDVWNRGVTNGYCFKNCDENQACLDGKCRVK